MIYHGHFVMGSFNNLRILKVGNCDVLKNLFSFATFKGLMQLEEIDVSHCYILEEIITADEREGSDTRLGTYEREEAITMQWLGTLKLKNLPQLKRFFSKKIELPKLVCLELASVNVKEIWPHELPELSSWSKNLKTVIVDGCENLSYLFTSSMIRSLQQLQSIEISNCKSMKEVILSEGEATKSKVLYFPKLDSLKLIGLQSLASFSSSQMECPSLKVLKIEDCPLLCEFISTSTNTNVGNSSKAGQAVSTLFNEKVWFPNLVKFHITDMNTLRMIWHDELQRDSFCQLKELQVKHGSGLVKIFPSEQLQRFMNLESLLVVDCNILEEVFDIQAWRTHEEVEAATHQLKYLKIEELPKLKNIWNGDPTGIFSFDELQQLYVRGCRSLKNLFPFSVAQSLPQLELLDIDRCAVDEIVAIEGSGEETPNFAFHKLRSLILSRLGDLQFFYRENHTLECPELENLSVYLCENFQVFASELGVLQTMHVKEQGSQGKIRIPQPLFSFGEVVPNLKQLSIDSKDMAMIQQNQFSSERLEILELQRFLDDSTDFAFGLFHKCPNIKMLHFRQCDLKMLLPHEEAKVLAQLKSLKLDSLPDHMVSIYSDDSNSATQIVVNVLKKIQDLCVWNCPSLKSLAPSSASFQNLSFLDVWQCDGLVKLVVSSTVESMVNLKKLTVRESNSLTEIVANKGDDSQSSTQIVLHKLETLELLHLKNLISFCSMSSCVFEFPSLNDLVVEECPNMKIFSPGDLTLPKLNKVCGTQDRDKWFWSGDLNATMKELFEETLGLRGLKRLKLSEYPRVKQIWQDELPAHLCRNLETLEIDGCGFKPNAIPPDLIQYLDKLETLKVINCIAVEQMFGIAWLNKNEFTWQLPKLTSFTVQGCGNLKSLSSLSMVKSIVNLKSIEISDCKKMETVIVKDVLEEQTAMSDVVLKELEFLRFRNLPKLVHVWTCDLTNCLSLKKLQIQNCPELLTFVSKNYASPVSTSSSELEISNSTLFDGKIQFPNLEDLELTSINVEEIWSSNQLTELSSWAKMTTLIVNSCGNLSYLFTSSMVGSLQQLKKIEISDCKSMKEVIVTQGEAMKTQISFPELYSLKLKGLQSLATFCTGKLIECPSLKVLCIENCPLLRAFISDSTSTDVGGEANSTLFDEKIQFCCLEEMKLASVDVEKLWPNHITESSPWIRKLTTLIVESCGNLSYLFTSTIVESLQNLQKIEVCDCRSMKEVIITKGETMNGEVLFPNLDTLDLKLKGLQSLERFCSGKLIKCPSLKVLWIENCPLLHPFISSSTSAYIDGEANSTLFDDKVLLANLEVLQLTDMHTLKKIWHDELQEESFSQLKELHVKKVVELLEIFPSKQLKRFKNVEKLVIQDCDSLEQVYDLQVLMETQEGKDDAIATQLKYLDIRRLKILQNVWKGDPRGVLSFRNLEKMYTLNCPSLEKKLFPFSISQDLPKIKVLNIEGFGSRCGKSISSTY